MNHSDTSGYSSAPTLDITEGEEYDSPHQVYKRLVEVVINETLAPELLPYEEAIVECIVDQVQHMSDNIKRLGSKLGSFCTEQHKIELERFSYVVSKYYRTRIEKIEANAPYLVKLLKFDRVKAARVMSNQEIKYLDNYVTSIDENLDSTVLNMMPPNMRSFKLTDVSSNDRNEMDTNYVFVKATKKSSVIVDDPLTGQEVVEMAMGAQHFLPYSAVRPHLQSGSKDLLLL